MSKPTYRVHIQGFSAVILFPALTTPALVKQWDSDANIDGELSIILATKKDCFDFYDDPSTQKGGLAVLGSLAGPKPSPKPGPIDAELALKFHSQLTMVPWGDKSIFDTNGVIESKKRLMAPKNLLYSTNKEAANAFKRGDYQGWFLGEITHSKPILGYEFSKNVKDNDSETLVPGKEKIWGTLHKSAVEELRLHDYFYLFQLNIRNFHKAHTPGLYEVAYIHFKLFDVTEDFSEFKNVNKNFDIMDYVYNVQEVRDDGDPAVCCHTDPDDDLLNFYVEDKLPNKPYLLQNGKHLNIACSIETASNRLYHLYDLNSKQVKCNRKKDYAGRECFCHTDEMAHPVGFLGTAPDRFMQSRHPVYIPGSWNTRIGALGDIHISSRQALFKTSRAQVIPGAKEEHSPFIGQIAHESLASIKELMDKVADNSDVVALVGDLCDNIVNADPYGWFDEKSGKYDLTTKSLWEIFDATTLSNPANPRSQQKLKNAKRYPRDIDLLMGYALILDLYNNKKKPVIAVTGNHDAYERPYGITPHLGTSGNRILACNAGIPSDHNLTIFESVLLFGQSYHHLGVELSWNHAISNFEKSNFRSFHNILTPWKDFALSYGDEQTFLALGWGDGEALLKPTVAFAGTLPRASEALDQNQEKLVDAWAARSDAGQKVILSHFTFASFNQNVELSRSNAKIALLDFGILPEVTTNYNDIQYVDEVIQKATPYEIGSFCKRRRKLYQHIVNRDIHYTISGHSHRPAVYSLVNGKGEPSEKNIGVIDGDYLHVRGKYTPNKTEITPNDAFFVCGSAGPYSVQNLEGEFGGAGMMKPQGMVVDLKKNEVQWIESGTAAKPRLASVMEMNWFEMGKQSPFRIPGSEEKGLCVGRRVTSGSIKHFLNNPMTTINDANYLYTSLNPKFISYFKGYKLENENPFLDFTLVAVGVRKKVFHSVCALTFTANPAPQIRRFAPEDNICCFVADESEYKIYFEELVTMCEDPKLEINYFASIRFTGDSKLAQQYDLLSPWCFPVDVETKNPGNMTGFITKVSRKTSMDVGSGNIPDLSYYGQIQNF